MVQECLTFATTPIFCLLAWASKYEKAPGAGRFFGNLFNVARVCWILWPIVLLLGKPLCSQVDPGRFNPFCTLAAAAEHRRRAFRLEGSQCA